MNFEKWGLILVCRLHKNSMFIEFCLFAHWPPNGCTNFSRESYEKPRD